MTVFRDFYTRFLIRRLDREIDRAQCRIVRDIRIQSRAQFRKGELLRGWDWSVRIEKAKGGAE